MEFSRQEYPALLTSLLPNQAVSLLNERVRQIGKINADIADWLLERRKVEELYVQGLKRVAARRQQDGASALGVFQVPWQSIVASTESLAESHSVFAQKIENDVERPLRDFQTKNREMQGITTIQGNLTSMAKELEDAHKRLEKLQAKGTKADTNKVSFAAANVQDASQQWQSQAPFVFEQLQALDESRVNRLRDVLTQLQTHEVDQLERSRATAESCLNVLLNVDTTDEISAFVARGTGGVPTMSPRKQSRTSSHFGSSLPLPSTSALSTMARPSTAASNLAPRATTPSRPSDDGRSDRSAQATPAPKPPATPREGKKGGMSGLKRLGTVISRRKIEPKRTDRLPSPDKRSKPGRSPLRRGPSTKNMQQLPSPGASTTDFPATSEQEQTFEGPDLFQSQNAQSSSSALEEKTAHRVQSGDARERALADKPLSLSNGASINSEPTRAYRPRPSSTIAEEVLRDVDGYNVPSSVVDDISRAEQEVTAEGESLQFKMDIRNEPIQEEDRDAQTALSNVANTLRAQAPAGPPQRKPGTLRGRRDVRNTVFVPNPSTPDYKPSPDGTLAPLSPGSASKAGRLNLEDPRAADAQSVRSAHSLSSISQPLVRHPEMQEVGLNASIVETVSAWFAEGHVTRAVVIGELALAYVQPQGLKPRGSETIRLENFPVLEKVAPNPTFINQVATKSGEYIVDLSHVARTVVAFKYQVHLEEETLATHAPMTLSPVWKVEATQMSVILSYAFNPSFVSAARRSVSLQNVVVIISVENAKATSCLSKPVGHFSKDKNLIYWRLGDITLDGYAEAPLKLLARFTTEAGAKPGTVEARWEISGENAVRLGSGLGVSVVSGARDEGMDPFADESVSGTTNGLNKEVPVTRKLVSGKYVAN